MIFVLLTENTVSFKFNTLRHLDSLFLLLQDYLLNDNESGRRQIMHDIFVLISFLQTNTSLGFITRTMSKDKDLCPLNRTLSALNDLIQHLDELSIVTDCLLDDNKSGRICFKTSNKDWIRNNTWNLCVWFVPYIHKSNK